MTDFKQEFFVTVEGVLDLAESILENETLALDRKVILIEHCLNVVLAIESKRAEAPK